MSDISITPASVLKSSTATALSGIAGATITQGQALYIDTTASNVLKLADSNGTAPANTFAGFALNSASTGQPVQYVASDTAYICGGTLTSGNVIYLSDTPGAITATYADIASGSTVITLGVATSTTAMVLTPVVGGVK